MTVYAAALLSIRDRESYGRYQARFMDVFRRYRGRLLAADESPVLLEGRWDGNKVVLMSFPDEAAFRAWAESEEYREIAKDRKQGASAIAVLIKGLPGTDPA